MRVILCQVLALFFLQPLFAQTVTVSPAVICGSNPVTLSIPAQPGATSYQWQSSNSNAAPSFMNIGGATGLTYATNTPKWYQVIVLPSNIIIGPVEVTSAPLLTASFTYSPTLSCSNIPVNFTNTSSAGTYLWTFGDPNSGGNNSSTQINPSHTFIGVPGDANQSFNVTLTVTSPSGCVNSTTSLVTVKQLPDARLNGPSPSVYDGKNYFRICSNATSAVFTFTNASTTTNAFYTIVWGDASPNYSSNTFTSTTHTFNLGTTIMKLIVTGQNGCIDTATYYIFLGSNPAVGLGNPGNTSICTGNLLTFPISGTSTNTPGTIYTVTFNDGSNPTIFTHPAPASVTHAFLLTSCGTNSPPYNNSFNASIQARNPCQSSSATVVPIYVSQKPVASFTVAPRDTICTNTLLSVTNTSGTVLGNDNGVCTPGKQVWRILPTLGWSLASGSLGNTFGLTDPSLWTNGSNALSINFSTPGSYTITLFTGNSLCGLDSVSKIICVNPTPIAAFNTDQNIGCAPLTVNTTNLSNLPLCGINTYQWSVTYVATFGCTPTTAGVTYLNGTSATSFQPQYQFTSPGVYTIQLITKSSSGICTSSPITKTVTVKGKPVVSLSNIPSTPFCQNGTISPTASSSCYIINGLTTYAWSFPGGTPSSSTIASPGAITYSTPGTYTVTLAVTNECGTTTVSQSLIVNPSPNFATLPNITVCPGDAVGPFSFVSNPTGAVFTWTNSNPGIGLVASGSGTIPVFSATNSSTTAISATINVTATLNGCTKSNSFTVTVNPKPAAPIVTTPVLYCLNATAVPLTASGLPGHILHWYNTASGGIELPSAPTPSTASVGSTNYYVSQTSPVTNCESIRASITVTVNPIPAINFTKVDPATCSGTGSFTITGLIPNTLYTGSYTNTIGTVVQINATSTAAGSITISGLIAGTYTNISVTRSGCQSNIIPSISLNAPSAPAQPTAGNNGPLCSGSTLNLNATTIAGGTYQWTGPNGFSSASQNPVILNAIVAASGTYTVTVTVAGCVSPPATTTVVINPKPSLPVITSNSPICAGTTLTLNVTSTTGSTFTWTGPGGFTDATSNPTIPNAQSPANTGIYSVIATLGTCTNTASASVTIKPLPVITATSTNPATCSSTTGSIVISALVTGNLYSVSYVKNSGSAIVANYTAVAPGQITIPNLSAGTYTNIFVTLNGCPSNIAGPFTLSDPNPPAQPVASNNGPTCSGNNLLLTTNQVAGANYIWTGPNGFTNNTQNPTIVNATTAASGIYTLTVTIAGCTSLPATTTAVVNPTPSLPVITSNSPICAGNTLTLNVTSTSGSTFTWAGPGGFTDATSNPTIPNAQSPTNTGTYTVVATLGTCTNTTSASVTIKPLPVITATSTNPTTCSSTTGSIVISGLVTGSLYSVSYVKNSGSPIVANYTAVAPGQITIPNLSAGTYANIFVTLNGCPSNIEGPFTLSDPNPPSQPVASNSGPICSGNTLSFITSPVAGATYNWSGPNGFSSSLQNPTILNATTAASGLYTVTATVAGCTSLPGTTTAVVNPTPITPVITTNAPICEGADLILNATSIANTTYSWSGPNGYTSSLQNPTLTAATLAAGGTYSVTATLGTCSATVSTTVIVKPVPVITATSTNPTSCSSSTGTIIVAGLVTGNSYSVSYVKNGGSPVLQTVTAVSGSITIDLLSQGVYSNIFVVLNGCSSNIAGPFTLADANPPPSPIAFANSPICSGFDLILNATTTAGGVPNFTWTGPNGFASTLQSPTIINASQINAGNYLVTVTINNCVSIPAMVPVVINNLPNAPVVVSPVAYCLDNIATPLSASVSNGGNTLNWYTASTGGVASINPPIPTTTTAGTTNYYVSQTNQFGCEGPRSLIQVKINPNAKAVFVPTHTIACASFSIIPSVIGLQQFPANNSDYVWYANNVLIGNGANFPGYIITNQNDSVIIKLVAVSAFDCKNDSLSVKFYTYKVPTPSFTKANGAGCGPLTVSFSNTTNDINLFTYLWDFGNGQTSSAPQPLPVTYQSAPSFNDTFYVVKLKVFSICDTLIAADTVYVKSKPKALFTPSNVNGCSPMHVNFVNTSKGIGNTYFWNFDDGQTFTTTSTATFSHTFNTGVIDTFYVKLIATNSCGSDSLTYRIIAAPNAINLNFSFNGTSQYGCAPHPVAFFNNSVGAGSFVWNFGDGNTITTVNNIDTVYHTYNFPGVYNVSVTAFNNCSDTTALKTITVYAKPVPLFTPSTYATCIGQSIQFTNSSTGYNAVQWQSGDGTFSSVTNPAHTYLTAGVYNVKLIVFNSNPSGNVCSDSLTQQITVTATQPGNITLSGTSSPCAPFTVTFNNLNLPATNTIWNFGDGQTAMGNQVTHTYTVANTYQVTANSTSPGGCVYISSATIVVGGPAGSLQYNVGYVCYPNTAFFQATATNANSYFWQFGDGITQTTTTPTVSHQYANPGNYLPSVTLQSTTGCSILLNGLLPVKVDKIKAGFTYSPVSICGSTNVAFTDTSNAYFGIALTKWDFGDAQTGTGTTPVHTYFLSGTYTVQMIAIGVSGCSDTTYRTINVFVKNRPSAVITAPVINCGLQNVTFTANIASVDAVNIKNWFISNGATGTGNSFVYSFSLPGTYTVRLIAGTVNGCYDTAYHTITVKPVPVVVASGPVTLCVGNSANLSVTGAVSYQWTPIQGLSCTTCSNPVASPVITTPYVVAGTTNGCTAYDTVIATVIPKLNMQVSNNQNICIGQSTQLQASGAATYIWTPSVSLNNAGISNPIATPTATTIYRVIGYDGQNCFTDTAFTTVGVGLYPVVNLGPDLTLAAGTQHPLTTLVQNGPIQQWLWTPTTNLSCSTCPLPISNIKKDITYAVRVTNNFGCSASDTVNIKVFCVDTQLFIPNAFTPDGDGINDVLMVNGKGIVNIMHFRIFNRWGELVFEKSNFQPNVPANGWDGKVKGKPATPDVFVYTAEVMCENGTTFSYKGNISIIK